MHRLGLIKLGDICCQVGVYLLTTMTVGQLFVDSIKWWMSLGFGIAGFLFIISGITILHYVPEVNEKHSKKIISSADIIINNAVITTDANKKSKKK